MMSLASHKNIIISPIGFLLLLFGGLFVEFALSARPSESMSLDADDDGPVLVGDAEELADGSNMLDLEPKSCGAAYECWRSEPILEDGRPMLMSPVKRLSVGGGMDSHRSRGARCRCRNGQCLYYSVAKRTFFNCQEL